MERSSETILVVLVIIALVLTAINAFVALRQVADIARVTGFITQDFAGRVNLTIPTQAEIRFNVSIIDWENGTFATGALSSNLSTSAPIGSKVVQGTWTETKASGARKDGIDTGLLIANIGNVNLSLQLNSNKEALAYIVGGGNDGGPKFRWNVTEQEPGSCGGAVNINASVRGIYSDVKFESAGNGIYICGNASGTGFKLFKPGPTIEANDGLTNYARANTLRIDFFIQVPSDAPVGGKTATITATGNE
ncbi:hypothetical protein HYV49_00150 [Candidatus Pacearchaeota archaeon]|nr:hypothetical protein [Candidatus Pacearchaeota archaeon]